MSPPRRRRPPPEFFVDRSLGRYAVPDAVRALGYEVHTLASVYGEQEGQSVEDVTWLREAGRHDWVVLLKDDRVRRRPAELDALIDARVRVFCLTNASLRAEEQALRFTPALAGVLEEEHVACLFRPSLVSDELLREPPRRVAQLQPEARRHLKVKLAAYWGRARVRAEDLPLHERGEEDLRAEAWPPSPYDPPELTTSV